MQWQSIGHSLEAVFKDSSSIWLRHSSQTSNHPCLILEINPQGDITNLYTPDGSHAGSIDSRIWTINLVKEHLPHLQNSKTSH